MKNGLISATCLIVAGCAGSDLRSTAAPQAPVASTSGYSEADPAAAREPALANVREVEVRAFAEDEPVCRVERPTGSRIAINRCQTSNAMEDAVADYILREELEFMRQQQIYQEQARQAQESAMRQGNLPGGQR